MPWTMLPSWPLICAEEVTLARFMTGPIERSRPPESSTTVWPIAAIPSCAFWPRIVRIRCGSQPPGVATAKAISSASARRVGDEQLAAAQQPAAERAAALLLRAPAMR